MNCASCDDGEHVCNWESCDCTLLDCSIRRFLKFPVPLDKDIRNAARVVVRLESKYGSIAAAARARAAAEKAVLAKKDIVAAKKVRAR